MVTIQELRDWVQANPGRSVKIEIQCRPTFISDAPSTMIESAFFHDSNAQAGERYDELEAIDLATLDLEAKAIDDAMREVVRASKVLERSGKEVRIIDGHQHDEATHPDPKRA